MNEQLIPLACAAYVIIGVCVALWYFSRIRWGDWQRSDWSGRQIKCLAFWLVVCWWPLIVVMCLGQWWFKEKR